MVVINHSERVGPGELLIDWWCPDQGIRGFVRVYPEWAGDLGDQARLLDWPDLAEAWYDLETALRADTGADPPQTLITAWQTAYTEHCRRCRARPPKRRQPDDLAAFIESRRGR